MTSWMVLSCTTLNSYEPMRLAGTWEQYSKNAISQLTRITLNSGSCRYFRWPYQATVMKMFEIVRSRIVLMIESHHSVRNTAYLWARAVVAEVFRQLRLQALAVH